jgi:hypothetical protein
LQTKLKIFLKKNPPTLKFDLAFKYMLSTKTFRTTGYLDIVLQDLRVKYQQTAHRREGNDSKKFDNNIWDMTGQDTYRKI